MQETLQVAVGVLVVIKGEFRATQLEETPQRFAQVRDQAHRVRIPGPPGVLADQEFALFFVEDLVGGKIAESKEGVAYAGVFPINGV